MGYMFGEHECVRIKLGRGVVSEGMVGVVVDRYRVNKTVRLTQHFYEVELPGGSLMTFSEDELDKA